MYSIWQFGDKVKFTTIKFSRCFFSFPSILFIVVTCSVLFLSILSFILCFWCCFSSVCFHANFSTFLCLQILFNAEFFYYSIAMCRVFLLPFLRNFYSILDLFTWKCVPMSRNLFTLRWIHKLDVKIHTKTALLSWWH